jgi:hypothetical protein
MPLTTYSSENNAEFRSCRIVSGARILYNLSFSKSSDGGPFRGRWSSDGSPWLAASFRSRWELLVQGRVALRASMPATASSS